VELRLGSTATDLKLPLFYAEKLEWASGREEGRKRVFLRSD